MENKTKIYFAAGVLIVALLFAAGYLMYVDSYSKSVEPGSYRSFSVSGEGKVTAIPDIAQFTFSVITEGGKDIAILQRKNVEAANKAIDFLKAQGIEDKDIKTLNFNLSPRYQTYSCNYKIEIGSQPCPPSEIVGYTITQTVSVKIRDFTKIGDVMSGVVDSGANSVSSLSFSVDDPTALENKAKEEAIAQAREKAQLVAKAGGFTIGKLLSIEDGYNPYSAYYYGAGDIAKESSFVAPPPRIEPGSQEVTINVTLRYEIK